MQEPEHAELLAESFFTTLCVIVSDLPAPPPTSLNDNLVLRRNLRQEVLHALAVEPRSHSEAMSAASAAVSRRDENDGGQIKSGGGASFRTVFTKVLHRIGQQRNQGSRATSGAPTFELKYEGNHEYDPSYYHVGGLRYPHVGSYGDVDSDVLSLHLRLLSRSCWKRKTKVMSTFLMFFFC
jgi:hypothetical protein